MVRLIATPSMGELGRMRRRSAGINPSRFTWSAKTQRHSCSAGQEVVLVVKSAQYGTRHNSA